MKSYLITTVASFLTLFLAVSTKGVLLKDYTIIDVPGAMAHSPGFHEDSTRTYPRGIDGNNIVGNYWEGDFPHVETRGFKYDGTGFTTFAGPPGAYSGGFADFSVNDVDGNNIVGHYEDESGYHGFKYDGTDYTIIDVPGAIHPDRGGLIG